MFVVACDPFQMDLWSQKSNMKLCPIVALFLIGLQTSNGHVSILLTSLTNIPSFRKELEPNIAFNKPNRSSVKAKPSQLPVFKLLRFIEPFTSAGPRTSSSLSV
jgi:hypothetical protein